MDFAWQNAVHSRPDKTAAGLARNYDYLWLCDLNRKSSVYSKIAPSQSSCKLAIYSCNFYRISGKSQYIKHNNITEILKHANCFNLIYYYNNCMHLEKFDYWIPVFEEIILIFRIHSISLPLSLSHWDILCTTRLKYVRARKGNV